MTALFSAWPRPIRGLVVGLAGDAAVTAVIFGMTRFVTVWASLSGLYVLPVLLVGSLWGLWPALITGLIGALVFSVSYWGDLSALHDPFAPLIVSIVVILVATAVVVGRLADRARKQATKTQALADQVRDYAEEQAALRRVATLVAQAVPPEKMFAAVTAEVGGLLGCDHMLIGRYDSFIAATVVGAWATPGATVPVPVPVPVGRSLPLGERNVHTLVFRTRWPARLESYGPDAGASPTAALAAGVQSTVGAPIAAEGRLWGVIIAASRAAPLPAGTEARLADFTDLVATAVANAENQAKLTASRARIVATADATRRQIERDLHDGVQQHLLSLRMNLRTAQTMLPADAGEAVNLLNDIAEGLTGASNELRELTRGLHPAALARGGLRPALKALARRSTVPVRLDLAVDRRLPEPVELAAYYTVAEALTNAAKHAAASVIDLRAVADEDMLRLKVRDDGRGGATVGSGSGLVGLTDRIEALGGRLNLQSPPGKGTALQVVLPLSLHKAANEPQYFRHNA